MGTRACENEAVFDFDVDALFTTKGVEKIKTKWKGDFLFHHLFYLEYEYNRNHMFRPFPEK